MHRESLQHRRWAGVKEAQDQERERGAHREGEWIAYKRADMKGRQRRT